MKQEPKHDIKPGIQRAGLVHRWRACIDQRYGTWRGALRAALTRLALTLGCLRGYRLRNPARIRRVVFICQGNICRSAYAQQVASRLGMATASAGLSTSTGALAPTAAISAAHRSGYELAAHRATDLSGFAVLAGDLFLVMEWRQAAALRRRLGTRSDVSVALLGLWCRPRMPHLHDPFTLSDGYFDQCFDRLRQAVLRLHGDLPHLSRQRREPQ
jgi:protein-tyrosine phosphatase